MNKETLLSKLEALQNELIEETSRVVRPQSGYGYGYQQGTAPWNQPPNRGPRQGHTAAGLEGQFQPPLDPTMELVKKYGLMRLKEILQDVE